MCYLCVCLFYFPCLFFFFVLFVFDGWVARFDLCVFCGDWVDVFCFVFVCLFFDCANVGGRALGVVWVCCVRGAVGAVVARCLGAGIIST